MRAARRARLAALLVAAGPALAAAHQAGMSYGDLDVRGDRVRASVRVSVPELLAAAPIEVPEGRLTPDELERQRGALLGETLGTFSVERAGAACPLSPGGLSLEPPDGLRATGEFRCQRPGRISVRVGLVERMPRGHTHLARVAVDGHVEQRVARAGQETFEIEASPGAASAWRFLLLGVEHIFTGLDHLAFLLGLLLVARGLREIAAVVTSFTAAHSIALALAALGAVAPPASLVEPLIAGSIVWVAAENLIAFRRGAAPARGRWPIAFAFGLVHGFGFAGALAPLALDRGQLAVSLLAFNLGVEAGQLAFVALALPALGLVRRSAAGARLAVPAGSAAVGAAGVFWLVQRLPLW